MRRNPRIVFIGGRGISNRHVVWELSSIRVRPRVPQDGFCRHSPACSAVGDSLSSSLMIGKRKQRESISRTSTERADFGQSLSTSFFPRNQSTSLSLLQMFQDHSAHLPGLVYSQLIPLLVRTATQFDGILVNKFLLSSDPEEAKFTSTATLPVKSRT